MSVVGGGPGVLIEEPILESSVDDKDIAELDELIEELLLASRLGALPDRLIDVSVDGGPFVDANRLHALGWLESRRSSRPVREAPLAKALGRR